MYWKLDKETKNSNKNSPTKGSPFDCSKPANTKGRSRENNHRTRLSLKGSKVHRKSSHVPKKHQTEKVSNSKTRNTIIAQNVKVNLTHQHKLSPQVQPNREYFGVLYLHLAKTSPRETQRKDQLRQEKKREERKHWARSLSSKIKKMKTLEKYQKQEFEDMASSGSEKEVKRLEKIHSLERINLFEEIKHTQEKLMSVKVTKKAKLY